MWIDRLAESRDYQGPIEGRWLRESDEYPGIEEYRRDLGKGVGEESLVR